MQPFWGKFLSLRKYLNRNKNGLSWYREKMLTLRTIHGPNEDQVLQVAPDETVVVGRDASLCDFALMDLRMSRRHFRVALGDGKWQIIDLKSTHGTFVNGTAVARHQIRDGDVICAGDTNFLASCCDHGLPEDSLAAIRADRPSGHDHSPLRQLFSRLWPWNS